MIAKLLLAATSACMLSQVASASPHEIKNSGELSSDKGAVRISVRSQVQLIYSMFVWFAPVGNEPNDMKGVFSVERGAGVPIAGSNMIDSQPKTFAVPPGHYKLIAYTAACPTLPPIGKTCVAFAHVMPTQRFQGPSVDFEVNAGKLTDAGEYILELPSDVDIGYSVPFKRVANHYDMLSLRWRNIADPVTGKFTDLPRSPSPTVAPEFASALKCERKPAGVIGMTNVYPFHC